MIVILALSHLLMKNSNNNNIYSEKQLKDIKNFNFITFWNIIFKQIIFVIDRIITIAIHQNANWNSWFIGYDTVLHQVYRPSLPKVHKQKIKRSHFLLQPLPGNCLRSNSDHRQKLTPIYQSLPLIMGQLLQQKYTDMAYPGKFDHKFAVKHWQQL